MNGMQDTTIPAGIKDPVNAAILAVAEDQVQGFSEDPFGEIARLSEVPLETVLTRIRAMLEAGTIRRVRQTLMAINLADGALVAWEIPAEKLESAFATMFECDPFTGHVVIRSTDSATVGSAFRLWTTLKVPMPYSMQKHAEYLLRMTGAIRFKLMPAKRVFTLGVGHLRRQNLTIGSKAEVAAEPHDTEIVHLSDLDWKVLTAIKRELDIEEIRPDIWSIRAQQAGVDLPTFLGVGASLNERRVIGRFSTFLEHVKPTAGEERVTRYNALFHWAVPKGREIDAGKEVGRFHVMTHAYWREGGTEFNNVNIMGVAHGVDKQIVLAHKAAIDKHLEDSGIPVDYTNVFWGGRSEIKPSEISPVEYENWCRTQGLDPASMLP